MKPNSLVMFVHEGVARVGVIKTRSTKEELNHTSVVCTIRALGPKNAPLFVDVSELLLVDLTEGIEEHDWRVHPVLSMIRTSDEMEAARKYRAEREAKPNEDPDDVPF